MVRLRFAVTALAACASAALIASVPPAAGATEPAFPYEDKLIEGADARVDDVSDGPPADEPQGYRATVAEVRMQRREGSNGLSADETGAYVLHRRETLNFGDILVEAAGQRATLVTPFGSDAGRSGRFLIRQVGMPLVPGWQLDNALGVLRTVPVAGLGTGYRFVLPTALVSGIGSYLSADRTALSVEHGRLVRLAGASGFGLERPGGTSSTVAASHRLSPDLRVAGQALAVRESPQAGDYQAWTLAMLGRDAERLSWRAQLVGNDRSRRGGWAEGEWRAGYDTVRVAGWRIDPEIWWHSVLLSSGQRGLSARFDHVESSQYWGLGGELDRYGALAPGRSAMRATAFSGNGGMRLDLRRGVGASLQVRRLTPERDDGTSVALQQTSASAFFSRSVSGVVDRLQYNLSDVRSDNPSRVHELIWSRDASLREEHVVGVNAGIGLEDTGGARRVRPSVGVTYSGPLVRGALLNAWLRHARSSDPFRNEYVNAASVQLSVPIAQRWTVSLSASVNTLVAEQGSTQQPLFGLATERLRERSLWLGIRYADAGGTPLLAGQPGAGRGAGSITGLVFEDANGDGVRQASERPVPGVRVWLDETLSASTGPDGRYEFPMARSGAHRLRIDPSTVRLPWGPAGERGTEVEVSARGLATRNLPLVRIGE